MRVRWPSTIRLKVAGANIPSDDSLGSGLYQYQELAAADTRTASPSNRGLAVVDDSSEMGGFFLVVIARIPKVGSLVCHMHGDSIPSRRAVGGNPIQKKV